MSGCNGGWPGGGGLDASLAIGTLGLTQDENLTDTYNGEFYTVPGEFPDPTRIANAGQGIIQVYQDGNYLLICKGVTANTDSAVTSVVRFFNVTTGLEIDLSEIEIYENGPNSDRDANPTYIPIFLASGTQVRCEWKTSVTNENELLEESTWSIIALRGSKGEQGDPGGAVDQMLSVYIPNNRLNVTPGQAGKNLFLNNAQTVGVGVEEYDDNSTFDVTTGIWSPEAGRYNIFVEVEAEEVTNGNAILPYLYNVTQTREERTGDISRGANGSTGLSLVSTVAVNGTDTFYIGFRIEGGDYPDSITLLGNNWAGKTRFQAQRVKS